MNRVRYGAVAGAAGAALALYNWWRRRPDYVAKQMSKSGHGDFYRPGSATTKTPSAVV